MAYGLKYWFEFDDFYGRTCKVELYKKSYTGSTSEISTFGKDPVIISRNGSDDRFETIIGSECTINLISVTNMQWSEFFNITYREWYVKYYISASIFWEGYIMPDMYQEPFIAPPYEVQLRATDQLGDLKEHAYEDAGEVPYIDERNLSRIIGDCLTTGCALNFGAGLHYLAAFNIYEQNMTSGAAYDPLEMTKIEPAIFYDENGQSNIHDVLDNILKILNCRVYYNRGKFEVMHIPQLAENSFVYRDLGNVGGVTSNGTISTHKIAVTRPDTSSDCIWSEKSMMLSVLPPLEKYTVKQNYNFRKNLIRNGNFSFGLLKENKPFYWTTSYESGGGEYVISNNKLIIEKVSTSYYTLMYQTTGNIEDAEGKINFHAEIKTTGSAAIEVSIGSGAGAIYLTSAGAWTSTATKIEATADTTIDILSDVITTTGGITVTIYSVKSSSASYAVFSDIKCELIPDSDNWFPDYKNYIGSGDTDNRLKETIEVIMGDMCSDADVVNAEAVYDGSLTAWYYSGLNLVEAGMSWLWKRSTGTVYENLLAFNVLDRINHFNVPAYKITGKLRAKAIDFRSVLTDSSLSGRVFMQGRMTYNAREASWEGDWLEIKAQAAMTAITFTISPSSWNPTYTAQNQDISITTGSGVNWEATERTGVSWLSITGGKGSGSGTFNIAVLLNSGSSARSETIDIKGNGIAFKTLVVTQNPNNTLAASPMLWEPGYAAANQTITVTAGSGVAWTTAKSGGATWLTITGGSGTGNGSFTLSVTQNTTGASRNEIVTLSAPGATDVDINVTQDLEYTIIAGTDPVSLGGSDGNTASSSINVTPDIIETTLSKIDTGDGTSWLKITSGTSKTGDFTLTVEAIGDNGSSTRSMDVRISDDAGNASDLDVTINQLIGPA